VQASDDMLSAIRDLCDKVDRQVHERENEREREREREREMSNRPKRLHPDP